MPTSIAIDKTGNTFVAGTYSGTITFGAGPGDSFVADMNSQTGISYFVASFDPIGSYRWGVSLDGAGDYLTSASLATDEQGNVLLVAAQNQSVMIDQTMYPGSGLLAVSFASGGAVNWAQTFGDGSVLSTAVSVNSLGVWVVAGSFNGNLAFGAQPTLTATNSASNIFVAMIGGQAPISSYRYGDAPAHSPGAQMVGGIAVDTGDDIVLAGSFYPSIQLDNGPLVATGSSDVLLVKFPMSPKGPLWSNHYGGPSQTEGSSVAVDPTGGIIVSGLAGGTVNLGDKDMAVPATSGALDGFVAKYSGANAFMWAHTFGSSLGLKQSLVAADKNSNVVLVGTTVGAVNFGGNTLTPDGGASNVYLAKLDDSGNHVWSKLFGDAHGQQGAVVATDPTTQDIVVAFTNYGSVDLGTSMVASDSATGSLVVARFHP